MINYKSPTNYIILTMTEVAGFWDVELEQMVQKLQEGGAVRAMNHYGKPVIVRVKRINPGRFGENDDA